MDSGAAGSTSGADSGAASADSGAAGSASGADSGAPIAPIDLDAAGTKPGPYAVGHVRYTLANTAVNDRSVPVSVWYPVDPATITSASPPAQYPLDWSSNILLVSTSKDWEVLGYDAAYEEPTPSAKGPFPLVMVSPGLTMPYWAYLYVGTRLASHGFVVAIASHEEGWFTVGLPTRRLTRARDTSFELTELLALNDAAGNPLHGLIDASKIALSGHSLGGQVTYALAGGDDDVCDGLWHAHYEPNEFPLLPYHQAECGPIPADPRIRAIVGLDGGSDPMRYLELARISVPSLIMGQAVETASTDTDPSRGDRWLAGPHAAINRSDSYRVDVPIANHCSFMNLCDADAVARPLGSTAFAWVLSHEACVPQGTFDPANNPATRQIVTTYMLAFLNTHFGLEDDAWMLTAGYAAQEQRSVEFFDSETCDEPLPAADYYTYHPHLGQCAVARQDPPDYFLENAPVPGFEIQARGYVVSGTWAGYAAPYASGSGATTIVPADFSEVAAGASGLCVQGSVGAAIGVNVNQAQSVPDGGVDGGAPAAETVAIGGSGIIVRYTNPGATALQLQILTPAGVTWRANLSGLGGTETVPWVTFGNPPMGTEISMVSLAVPGGSAAVPFDFCLQGIAQAP